MPLESETPAPACASLQSAIEQFRNRRRDVYSKDQEQIVRDARAAQRAVRDHAGRWLFELLQNSDDANAKKVCIRENATTIYVADDGAGLKPEAVAAICGTDYSDKTSGTIGRKGVGFKSVYGVSANPRVFIVGKGAVEFSAQRTTEWLAEQGFEAEHIPHQWIPFFVQWDEAIQQDPMLEEFSDYTTIVVLPDVADSEQQKAIRLLADWPPHALFAFRSVRDFKGLGRKIVLEQRAEETWELNDTREGIPQYWRFKKYTDHPHEELLETLDRDERRAITIDGVSFLIAAPSQDGRIAPTDEYLPLHVFYPTEQRGPVPLLLHAEFLVKSDRTALVPIADSLFNKWVSEKLADHVCEFVNSAYCADSPSSHMALLKPFSDIGSHPVAEMLWKEMVEKMALLHV